MTATTQGSPNAPRTRALDGGRVLAALGALILLVSLFLDWFAAPGVFEEAGEGASAWTVFELVDLLLAALAIAALASAVEPLLARGNRIAIPLGIAKLAGPAALVLVSAALINHPPAAIGWSTEAGAWIALAGAALMTVGALLGFARISLVVSPREHAVEERQAAAEPPAHSPAFPEADTRTLPDEPGLTPPPR